MPSHSRTWAESVAALAVTKIPANPRRKSLLIQNLSANVIYVCSASNLDVTQCIKVIDGYETENQGEFFLVASAAASDVRLEEIVDA